MSIRILAVDDQPSNLELLEEILIDAGYEVELAENGEQALAAVEAQLPDVILLDIMMPGMDGFEVARRLKSHRRTCFVPIVMLTALSDVSSKVRGLEAGADDFLNKPFRKEELMARIRALARIKNLRDELDTCENVVYAMVRALESKDPRSAGHSERVATLAVMLANQLRLDSETVESLARGAMLHDVGKIGVPEDVLEVAGPLEGQVLIEYQRHTELGEKILAPLGSLGSAHDIIRHHHERLDGSGYPDGLSGLAFSLGLEIVAAANLYDDLLYQKGNDVVAVEDLLRQEATAGRFHVDLIDDLLRLAARLRDTTPPRLEEILPPPSAPRHGRIALADDQPTNREVLSEILTGAGYEVDAFDGGQALLGFLENTAVDLVLVDVRMPEIDGFEVCRRIRERNRTSFLPVILITAYSEIGDRIKSAEIGADDFLTTPLNRTELLARVRSLLRLQIYHRDLEEHQAVILSFASALEAKDPYTRGHSARVGELAARLAGTMNLDAAFCDQMRLAGLLHDIGKVGVPEKLLNKPGPLSRPELKTVMSHPSRGADICAELRSVAAVIPYMRHHHERFDGGGYPDGLKGEEIPLGARILAIVDAYDALTSRRSYRPPLSPGEAVSLLGEETAGGKWDPRIYEYLRDMLGREVVAS